MSRLNPYAKAVVTFFAPTLTELALVLKTAADTGVKVDWPTFAYHAAVYTITAIVVWAVPNTPRRVSETTNTYAQGDV